ncbi:MAG: hypothetical protein ACTSWX_12835 [Promethearchaeota archaeon]
MSNTEKFCPECGTALNGAIICPKCGFDLGKAPAKPAKKANTGGAKKSKPKTRDDSTWKSLEGIISFVGHFSWIILAIIAVFMIIGAILGFILGGSGIATGVYNLLSVAIMAYLVWTYGKIYSQKSNEKDWSFLVNDVLVLGSLRIPKMLAYGIVICIFTYGTGIILIVAPALLIIFLGPEEFSWSTK